jgi:hypothetical protein
MFETIGYEAQKTTVIEWLRYAPLVAKSRELRIPFILGSDDVPENFGELSDAKICSHALMSLLGKGFRWWKNCLDHNDNMTRPMHKLTGKFGNKKRSFLLMYESDLDDHFEELKKEAEPIATFEKRLEKLLCETHKTFFSYHRISLLEAAMPSFVWRREASGSVLLTKELSRRHQPSTEKMRQMMFHRGEPTANTGKDTTVI